MKTEYIYPPEIQKAVTAGEKLLVQLKTDVVNKYAPLEHIIPEKYTEMQRELQYVTRPIVLQLTRLRMLGTPVIYLTRAEADRLEIDDGSE